jgi:hypothetical protein
MKAHWFHSRYLMCHFSASNPVARRLDTMNARTCVSSIGTAQRLNAMSAKPTRTIAGTRICEIGYSPGFGEGSPAKRHQTCFGQVPSPGYSSCAGPILSNRKLTPLPSSESDAPGRCQLGSLRK